MFKSASLTLLSKLLTAISNFATVILLSRFLGASDRGICGWYLVVIAISLVFSEVAAGAATGFMVQHYPINKIRSLGYLWSLFSALAITSFFLFLHKIGFLEWCFLSVLCWLNAANTMHLTLLLAKQRFVLFNGLNFFMAAGVLLSLFIFFQLGNVNRHAYLYSLLLAWGVAFIVGLLVFNKNETLIYPNVANRQLFRDGFSYGLANQAGHLASLLNSRLVYFLLPATVLGIYSNAISLSEALMMLPGSLGQVLFAAVLNNKTSDKAANKAHVIWWASLIILFLAFLVILLIPDLLYQYIFGAEFTGVKTFLSVLAAGAVFNGGYLILSYWQSANGKFWSNFYATLIGLAVNMSLCFSFYFSGRFNPLMAAYSISISFFALFIVSAVQFCKINGGWKSLFSLPSANKLSNFLK